MFVREVIAHRVSLVTVGVKIPSQTESQEATKIMEGEEQVLQIFTQS